MPSALLKAALERHRDDPPPRMDLSIPLDRLMDDVYCATLGSDLRAAGSSGWECVNATKLAWRRIPDTPGLYMFVWCSQFKLPTESDSQPVSFPIVLYVGKAGDGENESSLKSRYKNEYSKHVAKDPDVLWDPQPVVNRRDRLARFLTLVPLTFWFCEISETDKIHSLENRLFSLFAPPLNASGSARLRPVGKPTPAF